MAGEGHKEMFSRAARLEKYCTGRGVIEHEQGRSDPNHVSSTDGYYCEAVEPIDEQLCALIARHKEVSGDNPGFPGVDRVAAWGGRYGLHEQMLWQVFNQLYHEDRLQPPPVPTGFRRFVPIARFVRQDGMIYAVTHMKQFTNMSVVSIEVSLEDEEVVGIVQQGRVDLSLGPAYHCRLYSSGGGGRGMQCGFAVTPPLPDDLAEVEFTLKITPSPVIIPAKPRLPLKAATVTIK